MVQPNQQTPRRGARRRPGREPAYVWWIVLGVVAVLAVIIGSWRLLLADLALWCLYESILAPLECGVLPNGGVRCAEPVRGRPFGCNPAHQAIKNDALWRLAGVGANPLRHQPTSDPNRFTGELLVSPANRGRLDPRDRTIVLLTVVGTLAVIAGTAFGLAS